MLASARSTQVQAQTTLVELTIYMMSSLIRLDSRHVSQSIAKVLPKYLAHVINHLLRALHASKVPTRLPVCKESASAHPNRGRILPLKNFKFVVVVSAAALDTGLASYGKELTPKGTLIRFSSSALNSLYFSWRTLL